ncbi:hypothetical protein [Pseudarthrobacter phenanthrenivorans]|uniref:Membrane protein ArfC n=1 Tax=Pseudarthrobacter phenanthrenivorans TaxID=361575 RepID=A0A0B4CY81_PSEPS|nr:hypothetical protein [Pseudarthrobacter phenanthrenivorans]KIC66124.1 hypothetical protein RM50_12995 [Pseudarthrobacter phenanthrenivorans]
MDIVFWIILVVAIAAVIWWLLNRNKSAGTPDAPADRTRSDRPRRDGALEGGSAAASAAAAGTTGIPTAAGFGRPAEPAAPATAEEPLDSSASSRPAAASSGSSTGRVEHLASDPDTGEGPGQDQAEQARAEDQAEWETQWSEAGSGPRSGSSATGNADAAPAAPGSAARDEAEPRATASTEQETQPAAHPVHHDEYTAPHAPTLPGAESAAVESADDDGGAAAEQAGGPASGHQAETPVSTTPQEPAVSTTPQEPAPQERAPQVSHGIQGGAAEAETLDRTQSSALVENGADHSEPSGQGDGLTATSPAGHLAADEPYGAGSAAPGPDGSGPADYTVKGNASEMVYYEEGHPDYEQTRAEVWFESAAHAEAAGFRAPRRKRLY